MAPFWQMRQLLAFGAGFVLVASAILLLPVVTVSPARGVLYKDDVGKCYVYEARGVPCPA